MPRTPPCPANCLPPGRPASVPKPATHPRARRIVDCGEQRRAGHLGRQRLDSWGVLLLTLVVGKHAKHADVGAARHMYVAHDQAAARLKVQQQRGATKVQALDCAARCTCGRAESASEVSSRAEQCPAVVPWIARQQAQPSPAYRQHARSAHLLRCTACGLPRC